jgi:glycosyl transferase family 25
MSHTIDKIVYINLDKRPDRKEEIENELNSFDLKYIRYKAIEHDMGIVGCGYSHLNVLKMAKALNLKKCSHF